jgi:signal transduction histidine kinase
VASHLTISIKQRIYLGFFILVSLFAVNAVVTNMTLNSQQKSSTYLSETVNPSLETLGDLRSLVLESKMYTTNWVFLRYNQDDKNHLRELHQVKYPLIRQKITRLSQKWTVKGSNESLQEVLKAFDELLAIEKEIMHSLDHFADYDDPVIKLQAESKVEEEVLPRTTSLISTLNSIYKNGLDLREKQNALLKSSTTQLRWSILILAIVITCAGIFLSIYLTKLIIAPIKRMSVIVNNMGKGITQKINYRFNGNEMGDMVRSINNLSDKLQATATFAHEVGLRNFKAPYKPLSDEDTLGKALLSMRDNLKKGELAIAVQNRELERKNRELEQFAYVASHDLQEPLRTISGFVELFQKRYKGNLDDNADKYLDYILSSSTRMKVLITDLLEYSRIGRNKEIESVDCNKVLLDVLLDLDAAIKETKTDIRSDHLPVIPGYSMEIKQLFQNLIFNAIKFRKKGVNPCIKISAHRERDYFQFTVEDNGIGIAKEHHERIFIIFQRLHNRSEYAGSGIGLSHCKKIVELHKGRIWLESEQGKGTTFYFTIPQQS